MNITEIYQPAEYHESDSDTRRLFDWRSVAVSSSLGGRVDLVALFKLVSDGRLDPRLTLVVVSSVETDFTGGLGFFFTRTPFRAFFVSFLAGAAVPAGFPFADEAFGATIAGGLFAAAISLAATALQNISVTSF